MKPREPAAMIEIMNDWLGLVSRPIRKRPDESRLRIRRRDFSDAFDRGLVMPGISS